MGEIKLLGTDASPFTNRVQMVLNHKSIEYEFIEENLVCKSELLLTSNPVHKKVPVLFHAKKSPICESLIIIEYLDEIQPNVHHIMPPDPLDRAEARFWANYIDTKFYILYKELWGTPDEEGKEAIKKQFKERSLLLEEIFVKFSNKKAYFGGDDVGYLDVVLGCHLGWIEFYEKRDEFTVFDEVRTPRLTKWAKCMRSHQVIKDAIPGKEVLLDMYMMFEKYRPR